MKNIHILPTDKPSRLHTYFNLPNYLFLSNKALNWKEAKHIYIISDERIERGDWLFDAENEEHIYRASDVDLSNIRSLKSWYCKKIILTTDQDLIKYGVQAINDEFLEWFVKNPSCKWVEVQDISMQYHEEGYYEYEIIIPKEEAKQEGYICPKTKKQCDDECCVSAEDCHIKASIGILSEPKQEFPKQNIIDNWLEKNGDPEIDKQVEQEAKDLCEQETLEEVGMYQQELFNYLHDLGVTALQSEMQEIERIVLGMQNINALHFEIDALKREIKLLKNQKEKDKEMYSEEDIIEILIEYNYLSVNEGKLNSIGTIKKWFEQFKNK